jgi:hypothetical protein
LCKWRTGFFLQFSERITGSYPEIFERGVTEGDAALSYFKDFGWYPTIKKLANNDIFKIDEVIELPLHKCLYFLSCEIAENKATIAIQKSSTGQQVTQL